MPALRTRSRDGTQALRRLLFYGALTSLHAGAARVADGSPALSSTCSSCTCSAAAAVSGRGEGHHTNFPFERRLWQSQNPCPSYDVELHIIRRIQGSGC
jgi:hypothetical protein